MDTCRKDIERGSIPSLLKSQRIKPSDCTFVGPENMLIVHGRLYIPDHLNLRTRYIQEYHDTPLAGHQGTNRTFELLTRTVIWPKMWEDVSRYLKNCHTYRRANTSRLKA
jgi:hypothetical protein